MLENARLSTVKFKNISQQKVSYLPSHFGIYLKKELNFKKCFHSFIDLGLHMGLRENESCSVFAAKAGFFYKKKSI